MRDHASSRKVSASNSLLQRLAPLETGVFLPEGSDADRPTFDRPATYRGYSLRACFRFGFAGSCIAGGVALLVLLLVNPVGASVPKIDAAEHVGVVSLALAGLPRAGRQLWWRLPLPDGNPFPSVVADNLPAPRTARVAVGYAR